MMSKHYRTPFLLVAIMAASLILHLYLIKTLNVVEDESAYMMDAWQINAHVLPFREFGATKGPVFLFLLKGWQLIAGQTIISSRLFTSLLHIVSIPLLYLFVESIARKRLTALLAASLWAIVPAAVSLTTNVIHAPLELVWILTSAVFLTSGSHPAQPWRSGVAAVFFFLAVLTRATAIAFFSLFLLLLFFNPRGGTWLLPGGVKRFFSFCITGVFLLIITIAIVYPLYGWPKTAFFFNADAVLIADDQQTIYQQAQPSSLTMLFRGLLPLWYEGFPLIILTVALIFLSIRAITFPLRLATAGLFVCLAFASYQPLFNNLKDYWASPALTSFEQSAHTTFLLLSAVVALALLLPTQKISLRQQIYVFAIILVWLAGFIGFYRFWGRDPTPFYILETIPAFCIAAALAITYISARSRILGAMVIVIAFASFLPAFTAISQKQYRGTVAVDAAIAAGKAIEEHVPEGEAIFTAQPVYPFLGKRPLYKYLTHPGWYLAERAGIIPTVVRRTFFPDIDDLTKSVVQEVNWIVVDWRTNDVYFKEGVAETQGLRSLLANEFAPVAEIPNDVTEPIILYKRK